MRSKQMDKENVLQIQKYVTCDHLTIVTNSSNI